MKTGLVVSLAFGLVGCGSTGPGVGPPNGSGPIGWIYGHALNNSATVRVNARTGDLFEVQWTHPPVDDDVKPREGSISPLDGDLAEQGDTGWGWDRTFVLDASTGEYREFDPPEVAIETDFRWSADGSQVLFLRRAVQGDTRNRLVRLTLATGVVDTILGPDQVAGLLSKPFWIGSDTIGVSVDERPQVGEFPHHYLRIATATHAVTDFNDVPWGQYHIPLISADQKWLAHWVHHDSTSTSGEPTTFISLRLRNRESGQERTLWGAPALTTYEGALSIAFSPDSRFLATCQTDTEVTIFALSLGTVAKRLPLPHCRIAIDWSWGPEGPPQP
jgi:hypothetical protein